MVGTICEGIKRSGVPCSYRAQPGKSFCGIHNKNHDVGVTDRDLLLDCDMEHVRDALADIAFGANKEYIMSSTDSIIMDHVREFSTHVCTHLLSVIKSNLETVDLINSFASVDITDDNCMICLSTPENMIKTPCCRQVSCNECMQMWGKLNKTCPNCRTSFKR